MTNIEYGFLTESEVFTADNAVESGWEFTVGDSNLKLVGLRVKLPEVQDTTLHLWSSGGMRLAELPVSAVADEWVTALLDAPLTLKAGANYIVSCYNPDSRFCISEVEIEIDSESGDRVANLEFNSGIGYVAGRYWSYEGDFPRKTQYNQVCSLVDIVLDTAPTYYRYLIRSGTILYTIVDGALSPLDETELTSGVFIENGAEELPDGSLLVGLTDPEVLFWTNGYEALPVLTATPQGTPPVPQVVVTGSQDMSDSSILGIESATVTASEDVLFALSFDDGETWKAYNGSQWVTLETEHSGMTKTTMESIGLEAWAEVITSTAYRVRFVLMDTTSYVTSVVINYINEEG